MKHLYARPPSYGGYARGCRCSGCAAQKRAYGRRYMAGVRAGLSMREFSNDPRQTTDWTLR